MSKKCLSVDSCQTVFYKRLKKIVRFVKNLVFSKSILFSRKGILWKWVNCDLFSGRSLLVVCSIHCTEWVFSKEGRDVAASVARSALRKLRMWGGMCWTRASMKFQLQRRSWV